jgi:putative ABC transport system permease protein
VRTARDPYPLVPVVTRTIRDIVPDQPVERAANLEDVRAELLSPDRVNALVFSGFAGIELLIAVVGIAGVLAFSVSARTRELGMRLAVGCSPRALLTHVLSDGAAIAGIGIGIGAAGGFLLSRLAARFFTSVQLPGPVAVAAAAAILVAAAPVASWLPAARASRIDVIEALRSEQAHDASRCLAHTDADRTARLLLILTSDTNIATVISNIDMRLGRLERTPCSCRFDPATAAA